MNEETAAKVLELAKKGWLAKDIANLTGAGITEVRSLLNGSDLDSKDQTRYWERQAELRSPRRTINDL